MIRIKLKHGTARVHPNISKETIKALNKMVELAYNKVIDDKPLRMTRKRAKELYGIVKLNQSGYAGVLPDGKIVDRRVFINAVPVKENKSMGIPEPMSVG